MGNGIIQIVPPKNVYSLGDATFSALQDIQNAFSIFSGENELTYYPSNQPYYITFRDLEKAYKQLAVLDTKDATSFAKRFFKQEGISEDGIVDKVEEFKIVQESFRKASNEIIGEFAALSGTEDAWLSLTADQLTAMTNLINKGFGEEALKDLYLNTLSNPEVLDHLLRLGKNQNGDQYLIIDFLAAVYGRVVYSNMDYEVVKYDWEPAIISLLKNYPTTDVVSYPLLSSLMRLTEKSEDLKDLLFGKKAIPIIELFYKDGKTNLIYDLDILLRNGDPTGIKIAKEIISVDMKSPFAKFIINSVLTYGSYLSLLFLKPLLLDDKIPETVPEERRDDYARFSDEAKQILIRTFNSTDEYSGVIVYRILAEFEDNEIKSLFGILKKEDPSFEPRFHNVVQYFQKAEYGYQLLDRLNKLIDLGFNEWLGRLFDVASSGTKLSSSALLILVRDLDGKDDPEMDTRIKSFLTSGLNITSLAFGKNTDRYTETVAVAEAIPGYLKKYSDNQITNLFDAYAMLARESDNYLIYQKFCETMDFFDSKNLYHGKPLKSLLGLIPKFYYAWDIIDSNTKIDAKNGVRYQERVDSLFKIANNGGLYAAYAIRILGYLTVQSAYDDKDKKDTARRLASYDVKPLKSILEGSSYDYDAIDALTMLVSFSNRSAFDLLLRAFETSPQKVAPSLYLFARFPKFKFAKRFMDRLSNIAIRSTSRDVTTLARGIITEATQYGLESSYFAAADLAVYDLKSDNIQNSEMARLILDPPNKSDEADQARRYFGKELGLYISNKVPYVFRVSNFLAGAIANLYLSGYNDAIKGLEIFDRRIAKYIDKLDPKHVEIKKNKPLVYANLDSIELVKFLIQAASGKRVEENLLSEGKNAYQAYVSKMGVKDERTTSQQRPEELQNQIFMPAIESDDFSQKVRTLVGMASYDKNAETMLKRIINDCYLEILNPSPLSDVNFLFSLIFEITSAITANGDPMNLITEDILPKVEDIQAKVPLHEPWCDEILKAASANTL